MFSKSGIFVGAAAALLGVAAWQSEPASAAALHETEVSSTLPMDTVVNQMAVSYADLDLKRPADVATLYHRIDVAAGFACGSRYFTGSHAVSPFWTACKKQAVNEAIASLNREELSAYARRQAVLAQADGAKKTGVQTHG